MLDISRAGWQQGINKWHPDNPERGAGGVDSCGYCSEFHDARTGCSSCWLGGELGICFREGSVFQEYRNAIYNEIPIDEAANKIYQAIVADGIRLGYIKDESEVKYETI